MLEADVTEAAIARECDKSRSYICHVVSGRNKSPIIRAIIAKSVGREVGELWQDE